MSKNVNNNDSRVSLLSKNWFLSETSWLQGRDDWRHVLKLYSSFITTIKLECSKDVFHYLSFAWLFLYLLEPFSSNFSLHHLRIQASRQTKIRKTILTWDVNRLQGNSPRTRKTRSWDFQLAYIFLRESRAGKIRKQARKSPSATNATRALVPGRKSTILVISLWLPAYNVIITCVATLSVNSWSLRTATRCAAD